MKIFSVSLFFVSFLVFNNLAQFPDLTAILRDFTEKIRAIAQCGSAQLGLPQLDPIFLANYSTSLGSIGSLTNVKISIENTTAAGFIKYSVLNPSFSLFDGKMGYDMLHPQLRINGTHATTATLNNENLSGKGIFNVTAINVRISVQIVFQFWPSFKMVSHTITTASVDQITANITGFADSAKDTQVSQSISQGSSAWVTKNLAQINKELTTLLINFTNERLSKFLSFSDVVNLATNFKPSACVV